MSRRILGLDIRTHAVSAFLSVRGVKERRVEHIAHVPFSSHADADTSISGALETIFGKMPVSGALCMVSIPAGEISFRVLDVPFKNKKKIRQILPFELEPHVTLPVENLVIDFHSITGMDLKDRTAIIAGTVQKSRMAFYLKILDIFGIQPNIVTASGYPAAVYLTRNRHTAEPYMLADFDSDACTLFFIVGNSVCYIRSFRIPPIDSSDTGPLCVEIQRTMTAFTDTFGVAFHPVHLWITGNGVHQNTIETDLERRLGLSVSRTNLLQEVSTTFDQDGLLETQPPCLINGAFALTFLDTIGLDLVNFNTKTFGLQKKWDDHKSGLLRSGVLLGLVGLTALAHFVVETRLLEKKAAHLDERIISVFSETFPNVQKIVDPVHQMQLKIDELEKNTITSENTESQVRKIDILNEISKRIPQNTDVEFTKLVMGTEGVMITGETDTFNSVDDMKSRIEQVAWFKKVTISSATINRSTSRVLFNMKVQL